MDEYVNAHQDRSRNALNRAMEAGFLARVEELRADQAQFSSERILSLGINFYQEYVFPFSLLHRFFSLKFGMWLLTPLCNRALSGNLRLEKESERKRTKLVAQLEELLGVTGYGFNGF